MSNNFDHQNFDFKAAESPKCEVFVMQNQLSTKAVFCRAASKKSVYKIGTVGL